MAAVSSTILSSARRRSGVNQQRGSLATLFPVGNDDTSELGSVQLQQMLVLARIGDHDEQKALVRELLLHYDRDGDNSLSAAERAEFQRGAADSRAPVDLMLDAHEQMMRPSVAMQEIAARAEERLHVRSSYCSLFTLLFNLTLYLVILVLQRRPTEAYTVEAAVRGALFTEGTATLSSDGRVKPAISGAADFYRWLDEAVLRPIWVDPACGNSKCEPEEFVGGFMEYGCPADCNTVSAANMTNLTLTFDFRQCSCSRTADTDYLARVRDTHWNLCLRDEPSICAFARTPSAPFGQNLALGSAQSVLSRNITVFDAAWQVRLWVGKLGGTGELEAIADARPAVTVHDTSQLLHSGAHQLLLSAQGCNCSAPACTGSFGEATQALAFGVDNFHADAAAGVRRPRSRTLAAALRLRLC
jgi:hypothetical protein